MDANNTISLDIRGQICPSCLLLTLKAVNDNCEAIRSGIAQVLVVTDDRQAIVTIPAATDKMGYGSEVTPTNDGYRIRIFGR